MAESSHVDASFVKQVHDVLDMLGTGIYCITFSERGKKQNAEVQRFKEAICLQENRESFHRFCKGLIGDIASCIVGARKSEDTRREKSYRLFYQKRISDIPKLWDDFHAILHLPRPDPLWTQSANRLLFNQALVSCLQQDAKQEARPKVTAASCSGTSTLGADEENIIRYMAGYIPFKLLKAYKKKDSEEAAMVVDCLSAMGQSGREDDFDAYTEEWTKAISRGAIFEVSNAAFAFFRRLDIAMRDLLSLHLLSGTINRDGVAEAMVQDEALLFNWVTLSGRLSNEASQLLLREIIDIWMTIRGHAFARQLTEQHKYDSAKNTHKKKSMRQELSKGKN